ncbi:MAG: pyridoxal phosphate-dependent aminotransferase, partial [Polyangiaceae bacterium]
MSGLPSLSRTALAVRQSVFAALAPRIEARAKAGGDLVELHIGDTCLEPPAGARFASVDPAAFDAALYRYGSTSGVDAVREAFAARLARLGQGPPGADAAKHVLVASGATHAAYSVLRSVLDPGDEVLVGAPYWPLTVGIVHAAGGLPVEVPLSSRLYEDASLDAGALFAEKMTPRTRAIYLITPNNPDGKILGRIELARIARLAVARGLWVISDEVYAESAYEGAHASMARSGPLPDHTVSVYSLSKSHALAGARVGFAVGPERVIELARRIATHTVFN